MGFKDKFNQFKNVALETADKVKEASAPALESAKSKAEELNIKDKINKVSMYANEKAEKAVVVMSEVADKAKTTVVEKATEISPEGVEIIKDASEVVKDVGSAAFSTVAETAITVKNSAIEKAEELSPDGVARVREVTGIVKEKTTEMNLLNSTLKKEALEELKESAENYEVEYNETINHTVSLHETKMKSVDVLKCVENFINSIANSPKEIIKEVEEIKINRQSFEDNISKIEEEISKKEMMNEGATGAGVLVGAGVAALGPGAAMAIATTFGTTSTGVAISSLSGAAAANAATAWLGGGALSAGGGGMAGGKSVLAAFGPIGMIIGGAALVTGGLIANGHNQATAEKAEEQSREIKEETLELKKLGEKINLENIAVNKINEGIKQLTDNLISLGKNDYLSFSADEKNMLMTMVNSSQALSKRIGDCLS